MNKSKVTDWVDIEAPVQQVYDLVIDLERRMQLSPLWGIAKLEYVSPDYPQEGSRYHIHVVNGEEIEYDAVITEWIENRKLSYCLTVERETQITWWIQEVARGTRLTYEEQFEVGEEEKEQLIESVDTIISEWMKNIKRYCELPRSRFGRFIKWLLDRYYLKMRKDQRKTVQIVLFMQFVGLISFVMAAIALGIAHLLGFGL